MGKKKGRSKNADNSDVDDADSIASSSTICSPLASNGKALPEVVEIDQFEQFIEDTYEKRGATREKAFEGLLEYLKSEVKIDECENSEATVLARCLNSLRKGGANETALAAHVLGLLVITTGPAESVLDEVEADLVKLATQGKSAPAKVAAAEALAITCFVTSEGDDTTLRVMRRMKTIWAKGEARVKAAAMSCWSFLFTSLNSMLPADDVEATLEELSDELHDSNVEVRAAAGEAVALLYHSSGLSEALNGDDEGYAEDDASIISGDTSMSGLDDALDRMKDLATNKGDKLRRSKRDKQTLRSTFRGLCNILEDGNVPVVKIKLQHGDLLVVDTLNGVIAINFFKKYLAGGFQAHLQHNQLLHDVFQFSPLATRPDKLSSLEKRAYRSPSSAASKDRANQRKSERAFKATAMGW